MVIGLMEMLASWQMTLRATSYVTYTGAKVLVDNNDCSIQMFEPYEHIYSRYPIVVIHKPELLMRLIIPGEKAAYLQEKYVDARSWQVTSSRVCITFAESYKDRLRQFYNREGSFSGSGTVSNSAYGENGIGNWNIYADRAVRSHQMQFTVTACEISRE